MLNFARRSAIGCSGITDRSIFHMSAALKVSLAAWLIAGAALAHAANDLTRPYLTAYYDNCAFGTAHVQALRAYRVLLVPGYLGDLYPDYFNDHLRWLTALGVEHQKLPIRSGDRSAINGPIIATAIRQSSKPVILITHSKGSVDTLEALLADAGARAKVKGWLSLQGTFFGSPVADKLLDGSVINPLIASVILAYLGGTRESALDLTTGAAQAYYRKHAAAIGPLLREVPVIAFASAVDGTRSEQPSTALEIPYELMAREGIRNDGLVPLDAAALPGMDFVKVTGVDHIAPVMPARQPFNRVRMTQALLLMLGAPWRGLPRDAGCVTRR
jgi:hypothetical protein